MIERSEDLDTQLNGIFSETTATSVHRPIFMKPGLLRPLGYVDVSRIKIFIVHRTVRVPEFFQQKMGLSSDIGISYLIFLRLATNNNLNFFYKKLRDYCLMLT